MALLIGSISLQCEQLSFSKDSYVAFDLDGTLALYTEFKGADKIGRPIPEMIDILQQHLKDGDKVKIFTARVADDPDGVAKAAIEKWCKKYIGQVLPVTCVKDSGMTKLYDDRAASVERNTGKVLADPVAGCAACESGDCVAHVGVILCAPIEVEAYSPEETDAVIKKAQALRTVPRPVGKWSTLRRAKQRRHGKSVWKENPIRRCGKPADAEAFKQLPTKLRDRIVDEAPFEDIDPRELSSNQPAVHLGDLENFARQGKDPEPVIVLKTKDDGLYVHNGNHRSSVALLSGRKVRAKFVDLSKIKELQAATEIMARFLSAYSENQPRDDHGRWTAGATNTDRTSWHFGDYDPKETINGRPLTYASGPDYKAGLNPDLKEGPLEVPPGKHAAAGVIVLEPDGKVWTVTPNAYFGGYRNTFPKGTPEPGEALQQAALRETYEETGLQAKITGVLGDVKRDTSVTRYYVGERIGGNPSMAGEETYAVKLLDPKDPAIDERLTDVWGYKTADAKVLDQIRDHLGIKPEVEEPAKPVGLTSDVIMHQKTGGAQGSNVGGFYKGSDGVDRYVKFYQNPEQVHEEALANTMYRDLGVNAPNSHVFELPNGKQAFASDIVKGGQTLEDQGLNKTNAREVLKGFAADVLTANWDSVGLTYDNILMKDGEAHRIDNGASFLYRATHGPKPEAVLNQASEIKGFFNPAVNNEYARLTKAAGYSSASELPGLRQQVQKIVDLEKSSGGWGGYLSAKAPYLNAHERSKIETMLGARSKALADYAGVKYGTA